MKKPIKLTKLTKEELKKVSGGFGCSAQCTCKCRKQQVFGLEDSSARNRPLPK
jgi:bacteriocin-like protein